VDKFCQFFLKIPSSHIHLPSFLPLLLICGPPAGGGGQQQQMMRKSIAPARAAASKIFTPN
jgi:hypothetical protein